MSQNIIKEATTIEEALEKIAKELKVNIDDLEYEILKQPEHKILGRDILASVKAWVNDDSEDSEDLIDEGDISEDEEDEGSEEEGICEDEKQPFSATQEELSEEELDHVADVAIETLRSVLVYFDAEDVTIDEYEGDEKELLLDVVGDNLAVLIGRHGKTLDALQFLVSSMVNRKLQLRYPIVIDIGGYKYRRRQKIEGIAQAAAARAAKQNSNVRLRPMTPSERRIVHVALRDDKRIITMSEGSEPNRYVVVKPRKF